MADPGTLRVLSLIEANTVTGPAKLLLDFCRHARELELQPAVTTVPLTFVRGSVHSLPSEFLQAAAAQGLEVQSIRERSVFDPGVLSKLRRLSEEVAPDIVETHGTKSHFLMRISGLWRTYPWIAFHHGYTMDAKRTQFYNQLDRWSLRSPAAVVTVCEPFRQLLVQRGAPASRVTVLHNAISPYWLQGESCTDAALVKEGLARASGQHTILAIGRLSKEKAFIDLIFALDHLRRLHPRLPVRLLILGDGPEQPALQRAIHSLRLESQVLMLGHIPDVRPYFRRAEVLAISSLTEGEPMVLLEAMAAGVPAVATAVGGIPDMVRHRQSGLLVAPKNPAAMAEAIAELLHDRALSALLAQGGLEQTKSRYSAENRTRSLIELYESVYRNARHQQQSRRAAYTKA